MDPIDYSLSHETCSVSDAQWFELCDASRLTGEPPQEIARQAIDAYLEHEREVLTHGAPDR